jgi:thiosulfate dehydrogenase [quinone] large subunit
MLMQPIDANAWVASGLRSPDPAWTAAALAMLPVRVIQGFIYWGGGSRRFIYGPAKLDPSAPSWMANKLQGAMPGALLGTDQVIAYLLQHFWLLYAGVILFSLAELVVGAALMAGFLARLSALVSMRFSVVLMLMFGWQGATCIDEWTMAACNLAMGATLLLAGSGAYAVDSLALARRPQLAGRTWFLWLGGSLPLPLAGPAFRRISLLVLAFVLAFDVGTYSYYRGSVVTPYRRGPVSPSEHHLSLSDGVLRSDGQTHFSLYLDGGSSDTPAHIMEAEVRADGQVVERWDLAALTRLPSAAIRNVFAYNQVSTGPYGLTARMGARATLTLPPVSNTAVGSGDPALTITDVDGRQFSATLRRRD